ncbi:MAG TPA: class I adenylate-forming enzyme family protein [Polyangiales bacterium]
MADFTLIDANSGSSLSAAALEQTAEALVGTMKRAGAGVGDTVSLVIRDRFQLARWLMAGLLAEVTVNPINPQLSHEEISAILDAADTKLVISDQPLRVGRPTVRPTDATFGGPDARQDRGPDAARRSLRGSLLIFTSGTTGKPKGVALMGDQLASNAAAAVEALSLESGWVTASVLPLFHTFTLVSDLLTMWLTRGICVVCPAFGAAELGVIGAAMRRYQVRSYSGVPIVFKMLSRFGAPEDYVSLRFAVAGAAPLFEDTRLAYERLGHPVLPCYGLSETCCFVAISPPGAVVPGAVGKPSGIDVRIASDETTDGSRWAPSSVRGEICVRGPSVLRQGYWKGEHGSQVYRDGYFRTGDLGFVDDEGYLHITGRLKNMLNKGGEKLYLEDLDRVLSEAGFLRDFACVVTRCDEHEDQYACCVVVDGELTDDGRRDLRARIVSLFGAKAAPSRIVSLPEIPRSPTGKVQLLRLATMLEQVS